MSERSHVQRLFVNAGLFEDEDMIDLVGEFGAAAIAVWLYILCRAKRRNYGGLLPSRTINGTAIVRDTGASRDSVSAIVERFREIGWIDTAPGGDDRVCKWAKYQKDTGAAQRKKEQREREAIQSHGMSQCHDDRIGLERIGSEERGSDPPAPAPDVYERDTDLSALTASDPGEWSDLDSLPVGLQAIHAGWPGFNREAAMAAYTAAKPFAARLARKANDHRAPVRAIESAAAKWEPGRALYGARGLHGYLIRYLEREAE